jgi:hypothetical protein
MPNNFTSVEEKRIADSFIKSFQSARVLTKTVNTSLISGDIAFNTKSGDKRYVPRPYRATAVETATGDITGLTADITAGQAVVTVQPMITAFGSWNVIDQALRMGNLDEIMKPYAYELITKLEGNLGSFMQKNSGLLSGTPGTPITKWSDVAGMNTLADSVGVPVNDGNMYAVINPAVREALADAQKGLANGDDSLVNDAWRNAKISRDFGGLTALSSNHVPSYQSGASTLRTGTVLTTPDATYVTHKDTMIQTVTLTGLTASVTNAVRPGDQIRITQPLRSRVNLRNRQVIFDRLGAQEPWTWTVVTGGNTNVSGQVTVTVTAPAINETNGPYNNISNPIVAGDTFALLGTANTVYQSALFYHRDAFALASVDLPKLWDKDTIMKSEEGFSIRMTKYSNGDANTNKVRFDLLPAFGVLEPLFAGNGFGK